MYTNTIVISAVNLVEGGSFSILLDCLEKLAVSDISKEYRIIALVNSISRMPKLKGIEYINFIADIYKVPADIRQSRIDSLAERFGIKDALNTSMKEYSHGMRQKLMIIAALIHNPPAWILDEPMTGLDPSAAFELKSMMRTHADEGNCVLFSTHVLEVAEKLCDRILIINHGKDLYQGTVEDLEKSYSGEDLEQIFIDMI